MEQFITDLSLLLVFAGMFSVLAMYLKQPVIIAYIVTGMLIGPWGLKWIHNVEFIEVISHLGITLLLFLAGLNLHPQKLLGLFKRTALITIINCAAGFLIAFLAGVLLKFTLIESFCMGLALMYSSTILVVKLLPTTQLHHGPIGAVCIGILIIQDLLAVGALAFLHCMGTADNTFLSFAILMLKLGLLIAVLALFERFILTGMMKTVDRLHEVLFVLGLAWCFGIATLSYKMGLFYESGAFFAGVVLARHPISRFIADKLRPLRDFFLVLFFFSLGTKLDFPLVKNVFLPASLLAGIFIVIKPFLFRKTFEFLGETEAFSREAGIRLGQLSEFSLLVAVLALELHLISPEVSQFIQLVTILTFILSSYVIVYKYPTPIDVAPKLTRD